MTGLKIQIPTTFTDTSLPVVYDDPLMTAGSLMLVDVGHSLGGLGAAGGVPADGGVTPNIAWGAARTMIGSGDATTLAPTWTKPPITPTSVLTERSSKKGLHVLPSQVSHVNGQGMTLNMPAPVMAWINNNPTHSFYISVWQRTTRPSGAAGAFDRTLYFAVSNTVYRSQMYAGPTGNFVYPSATQSAATLIAARTGPDDDASGAKLVNVGTSGFAGTPAATLPGTVLFGAVGVNAASTAQPDLQHHLGRIFYRLYIEDLTVSGRTYAQADAADLARYTTDMLTAGGRFYGDTYTAPSAFA